MVSVLGGEYLRHPLGKLSKKVVEKKGNQFPAGKSSIDLAMSNSYLELPESITKSIPYADGVLRCSCKRLLNAAAAVVFWVTTLKVCGILIFPHFRGCIFVLNLRRLFFPRVRSGCCYLGRE